MRSPEAVQIQGKPLINKGQRVSEKGRIQKEVQLMGQGARCMKHIDHPTITKGIVGDLFQAPRS